LQGGDDVDEVAQVAAEPVDPPDDQGVAGRCRYASSSSACGSRSGRRLAPGVSTGKR